MSDLSYTFADIYSRVSHYLGTGFTPSGNDLATVKKYANDGYRLFLAGVDPRSKKSYQWSFLSPVATIATGGTYVHDMPADFGGIVDDPTYLTAQGVGVIRLLPRNTEWIRQMRAGLAVNTTAQYYAIEPKPLLGGTGHTGDQVGYQMLVYPTGSTATLQYRYQVAQRLMTNDGDRPIGARDHGMTIMQAALAIAERRQNDTAGPETALFAELMAASIDADARMKQQRIGPFRDDSDYGNPWWNPRTTVTYR